LIDKLKAWECIGCGRLEGHQPCLGICQDRKVELVYGAEYERVAEVLRQLATVTPREGAWEATYREMQRRAREALRWAPRGSIA
jgi:hypothetical protein